MIVSYTICQIYLYDFCINIIRKKNHLFKLSNILLITDLKEEEKKAKEEKSIKESYIQELSTSSSNSEFENLN